MCCMRRLQNACEIVRMLRQHISPTHYHLRLGLAKDQKLHEHITLR